MPGTSSISSYQAKKPNRMRACWQTSKEVVTQVEKISSTPLGGILQLQHPGNAAQTAQPACRWQSRIGNQDLRDGWGGAKFRPHPCPPSPVANCTEKAATPCPQIKPAHACSRYIASRAPMTKEQERGASAETHSQPTLKAHACMPP